MESNLKQHYFEVCFVIVLMQNSTSSIGAKIDESILFASIINENYRNRYQKFQSFSGIRYYREVLSREYYRSKMLDIWDVS